MSNIQKVKVQKTRHKTEIFDLRSSYHSVNSQNSQQQQKLQISLRVKKPNHYQCFRSIFTNQNVPNQVISTFCSLDIVYQCFKQQAGFQVDPNTGSILVKAIFEIKGRKIEKRAKLTLDKYNITQFQNLFEHIQDLQEQILKIKVNKQERQKALRKQYEKKLEAQKLKFEMALKKKQQQIGLGKQKQIQLQSSIHSLKNQISTISNKIEIFTKEKLSMIEQLKAKSQNYQKEVLRKNQQLEQFILFKKMQTGRKKSKLIIQANQKNKQQLHQNSQNLCNNKISIEEPNSAKITQVYKYVDENSHYINQFQIRDNRITYIGQQEKQTLLLMKQEIPRTEYHFQFKIIKTKDRSIMIGVVDRNQASKQRYSDKKSVSYWAKTGYIWGGNKFQGDGYKEGDVVHVKVQLNKPSIEWIVNGQKQANCQPKFFLNQLRKFAPFIQMQNQGDCVIWKQIN